MLAYLNKNGKVYLNQVDLNRFGKNLSKELDLDQNEALEAISKALGKKSHYDLLQHAKSPIFSNTNFEEMCEYYIKNHLLQHGKDFPQGAPFDSNWQEKTLSLLEQASDNCNNKNLEFIAIVGKEGSGKTLLSKAFAKKRDGLIVNAGHMISIGLIPLLNFGFESKKISHLQKNAGPLIIDQSVAPITPPEQTGRFRTIFPDYSNKWHALPDKNKSFERFLEITRERFFNIPETVDEYRMHSGKYYSTIRKAIVENPKAHLIAIYKDKAEVEAALDNSLVYFGSMASKPEYAVNWSKVHVVDLDSLELYTITQTKEWYTTLTFKSK